MSAFVSIVLTHRRSGIGCDELERGRVAGSGGHNDGVLHRAVLAKRFDDLRNGGFFLANRDVNTDYAAVFLIDYSIDCDSGLADLAVTDDEFALPSANRSHCVDCLETGVHRLVNGLPCDNARSYDLDSAEFGCRDGAFAIERVANRVYNPAENRITNRNFGDTTGTPHFAALFDVEVFAHDGHTHIVLFEVEGQSEDVSMRRRELKQFHRHALFDSVNAGNTVAYGEHPSGLAEINLFLVILDLLSDDLADFFCSDFHLSYRTPLQRFFKIEQLTLYADI